MTERSATAAELLEELESEPHAAGRVERLAAALDATAWRERVDASSRYRRELRTLLVRLFPDLDFVSVSSEALLEHAVLKMTEFRELYRKLEEQNRQLSEALIAMQDVLSAVASLRR